MKISLKILADELSKDYPDIRYAEKGQNHIDCVDFFQNRQQILNEHTLYIYRKKIKTAPAMRRFCFLVNDTAKDQPFFDNYILIPDIDLQKVMPVIQAIIIRIMCWQNRILNDTLAKSDLQILLDDSQDMFPKEVTLLSVYHNRLFRSSAASTETISSWDSFFKAYYDSDTMLPYMSSNMISSLHAKKLPTVIRNKTNDGFLIICNIFYQRLRIGALVVPLTTEEVKDCYAFYLQELANCVVEMFKKIWRTTEDDNDQLLVKLLDGKPVSQDEIIKYCETQPWLDNGHTLRVSIIKALPAYQATFKNDHILFRNIVSCIYSRSHVFLYDEYIVLIRDFTTNTVQADDPHSQQAIKYLDYFLNQVHAVMGSSAPFSNLRQLAIFFRQAKAVAGGMKSSTASIHDYSYYLPYNIICSFAADHSLEHYIHPDIARIAEAEQKNHTNLLYTLYCYLLNDRSYQICAKKLYIHRNTFAYRISKIQSMLTCDYRNENIRLSLIISITMYWYQHPDVDPIGISSWR